MVNPARAYETIELIETCITVFLEACAPSKNCELNMTAFPKKK